MVVTLWLPLLAKTINVELKSITIALLTRSRASQDFNRISKLCHSSKVRSLAHLCICDSSVISHYVILRRWAPTRTKLDTKLQFQLKGAVVKILCSSQILVERVVRKALAKPQFSISQETQWSHKSRASPSLKMPMIVLSNRSITNFHRRHSLISERLKIK